MRAIRFPVLWLTASFACTTTTARPPGADIPVPVRIQDHSGIASEDGPLTLLDGQVGIQRLVFVDDDQGRHPWIADQLLDLGATETTLWTDADVPVGPWSALEVVLGPVGDAPTMDVRAQGEDRDPVRVVHDEVIRGNVLIEPGAVRPDEDALSPELDVGLVVLFFYTRPYGLATDGVWDATVEPMDRGFLEQNLVNAMKPVSPSVD